MTVEALLAQIRVLPVSERKRLVHLIVDTLTEPEEAAKTHSILEFAGVAAALADDEDPQEYINRLRDEWDREI